MWETSWHGSRASILGCWATVRGTIGIIGYLASMQRVFGRSTILNLHNTDKHAVVIYIFDVYSHSEHYCFVLKKNCAA